MALDKWNKELEKEIIQKEMESRVFEFKDNDRPVYSIDTPPPYINSPVHIGHASTYSIMDFISRYKRLKGFNVLFPLGLDRNGLPIEMAAEKKFKISILTTDRESYIDYCKKILEETSTETSKSFAMLGISFNTYEETGKIGSVYKTDSEKYRTLTQETFIELYKKGLIYLDEKVTNYCPGCKTTLADSEIDYKIVDSKFYTILFSVKETGEKIPIATTRPELVCSLGMVIFNPEDERWQKLNGKTAVSPLFNREVPIKAHPMAKTDKGTGLVMMCSAGDYSDIRFFVEQGIKPIISIDISGKMNKNAEFLEGLSVKEARQKMVELLNEKELVTEEKTIQHKVPICERSKHEIEFISLKEYYLKQMDYIEKMKEIAETINFTNPATKKILLDWLDVVSIDWPISRRRYYATEIPIWYCKKCGEAILGEKGKYHKPWKEKAPVDSCPKCGGTEIEGETRVFDTWFDSSISPLFVLDYGSEFYKKHPVCSLRPQGKEIVRTWLYYTLLKCYLFTGKIIFDDVYIHQHILDDKGNKMAKSLGNAIDPQEILRDYGAEAFRLWVADEGNLNEKDLKCSKDRISTEQKTLNKLWNVSKFISQFDRSEGINSEFSELDKAVLKEINNLIELCDKKYSSYDFHEPIIKLKYFLWTTFSSHYLELVKSRAYNQEGKFNKEEQNAAIDTLNYCLERLLVLLFPVIPFTTHKILVELFDNDPNKESYPETEKFESALNLEDIENLNNSIWKYKKDNNLSLKDEIKELKINKKYKCIEKDIQKTHNILNIQYLNDDSIEVN
ncbi:MAG TPA: valine--tRNA ligase [Candidatus Diapherotrites archaeon]|nr:valine--tRNA ligase [Candidatus Diapherotrites archaeon]